MQKVKVLGIFNNTLPTVNNTVLCTSKFKSVDLTLNVTITKAKQERGTKRIWEVLVKAITLVVVMVS